MRQLSTQLLRGGPGPECEDGGSLHGDGSLNVESGPLPNRDVGAVDLNVAPRVELHPAELLRCEGA